MESQQIRTRSKSAGKPLSGGGAEPQGGGRVLREATRPGLLSLQFTEERRPESEGAAGDDSCCAESANEISSYLFGHLHGYRIPTHFVGTENATTMLVRRLEMVPVCIRVWNSAGVFLTRRFGLREGADLPFPVLEHYYTGGEPPYPLVNEFHLFSSGTLLPDDLRMMNRLASKANAVLRSLFARRGLKLHLLILEFGRGDGQLMLAGELTPRTFSAGDAQTRARRWREIVCGGAPPPPGVYREVRERLLAVPAGAAEL